MKRFVNVMTEAGQVYVNTNQVCITSPLIDKETDTPIIGKCLLKMLSGEILVVKEDQKSMVKRFNGEG